MEISGKGSIHSNHEALSLMGHQTNYSPDKDAFIL